MKISNELFSKLCCPNCKGKLIGADMLRCEDCEKQFPIKNDIIVFLDDGSAYDQLYEQIDFNKQPFAYEVDYATWRKGQINKTIAKFVEPGSVLDDGGGYGFLKEFLNDNNIYYNLEYSYQILSYDTGLLKYVGNGEELPFKDDSFDNVVSGDVLEHVQDKKRYLQETYRVLNNGGVFILNTPRTEWMESYKMSVLFWIPYLVTLINIIKGHLVKNSQNLKIPEGVVDIPSDEKMLRHQLEYIGYKIIVQTRTDNHLPGLTHKFWRKFCDIFINPEKFGHCVFFVCRK